MFHPHKDPGLKAQFKRRPYQGATPGGNRCHVLFIGLDANFDPHIGTHPIYPSVLGYLTDGPLFWKTNGVHHPFLLPGYTGNGRRYHVNFSKIGLTPIPHADCVSFIELIDEPTTGQSKIILGDLNPVHMNQIAGWVSAPATRLVFISKRAGNLMAKSGYFPWMHGKPVASTSSVSSLNVWGTAPGGAIAFDHFHFSVYGRWHAQLVNHLSAIGHLIGQC